MPKNKKILGIILFLAFNIVAVGAVAYIEYKDNNGHIIGSEINFNIWFLLAAFGCFLLAAAAETMKYYTLIKHFDGKCSILLAFRIAILGKYYDYITPSGIGGQPFQIYYLNKSGVSVSSSASTVVSGFISMQVSFILFAIISFILGGESVKVAGMRAAAYIGLFFYAVFPITLIVSAFFPKFSKSVLHITVKFLSFIRIVKNSAEKEAKWSMTIEEYSVNIIKFFSNIKTLVPVMLQALLYQGAIASIAYFVIRSLGGDIGFLTSIAVFMFVQASVSFIPTPGNAGAAESSFYIIFGSLSDESIFLAMILWRVLTCYGFIITGVPISLTEMLRKRKEESNLAEKQ